MHGIDMLGYGHKTFLASLEGLDLAHVNDPGVCGVWSAKDVVGHLGVHEAVLVEILNGILGIEAPTPNINKVGEIGIYAFNDSEAEKRSDTPYEAILAEYNDNHEKVMGLVNKIPQETFTIAGLLAWYGEDYDLEDFLVYSYYAHKREHAAQINVLKDRLQSA